MDAQPFLPPRDRFISLILWIEWVVGFHSEIILRIKVSVPLATGGISGRAILSFIH